LQIKKSSIVKINLDIWHFPNYNKCKCEAYAFNSMRPHNYQRIEMTRLYADKTLTCKECGREFVFTAGEQEFYAEKGFQNEPTRCKECRAKRKAQMNGGGAQRKMYPAICADCGKECMVPFEPREDRPVYCSECFARRKQGQLA